MKQLSSIKAVNQHKGSIESLIISEDQYIEQISSHSLQLLITLWLPKECVLMEEVNPRAHFRFSRDALITAIDHHRERDLRVARKHFLKKDRKKARKILLHFIRYLDMAVQLKTSGQINDYLSANVYKAQVLGNFCEDWDELLCTVNPITHNLWSSLIS